uniref:OSJNBa0004N05.5 protein n=2 Tax=Oryza sativa TaxID=4530 RepID=Q7XQ02_ORYSJ|nr:OSJNBa0004N05.5 [Oryza sativa Japonica Group]CAH68003.1 OSIGBa0157K09-H0214G12.14 [Oryza sativa]
MAAAWFTMREAHAGAVLGFRRGSGARRGARRTRRRRAHARERGTEGAADRGQLDPVRPSWRRRGAFVAATRAGVWRKKGEAEMDGGRRRHSPGQHTGIQGRGKDTGVMGGTRGSESPARIHRREAGGDESRWRMPAASKEGKRRR